MVAVICCVEMFSAAAGVDVISFTHSIARHCKLVREFVIYYENFGGLVSG
jgi:hypothetical protein